MSRAARLGRPLTSAGGFSLALLDLGIGTARKLAGFCALLALGWLYSRELLLGQSLHQIFPGAPDPDLRETLWVALLLIMAQGWTSRRITLRRISRRSRGAFRIVCRPHPLTR